MAARPTHLARGWWRRALSDQENYAGSRQQMTQLHFGVLSSLGVSAHRTRADTGVRRHAARSGSAQAARRTGALRGIQLFDDKVHRGGLSVGNFVICGASGAEGSCAGQPDLGRGGEGGSLPRRGSAGERPRREHALSGWALRQHAPRGSCGWLRRTLQGLLVLQEAALVDDSELCQLGRRGAWHMQHGSGQTLKPDESSVGWGAELRAVRADLRASPCVRSP